MVDDKYLLALSAFHLGMALFCTNQLLLHQRHQRVYVPLALFFVTQSVSEILVIVDLVVADEAYDYLISRFNSLHVPAVFAQPLLLWLYVRALTSEDDGPPIRQDSGMRCPSYWRSAWWCCSGPFRNPCSPRTIWSSPTSANTSRRS
ncbi:hypothetical protein ACM258_18645 [Phaeobacter piscinae]|uniref:hypothetical protein n=1 Tax=Phaeobacter piscinae TaxID=1580596 RepID=UPI0039F6611B